MITYVLSSLSYNAGQQIELAPCDRTVEIVNKWCLRLAGINNGGTVIEKILLLRLRPHSQEHPGDIHLVHTSMVVLRVRLSPVPQ